jgi:hydrogenase maturation protease
VRTIIIGLGNPLRADDGVGLHVSGLLREYLRGRDGVEVVDLGAGGLRLAEAMSGYDRAILVDAMLTGEHPPGAVRRVSLSDLGGSRTTTCAHDTSLPTALEICRRLGSPLPREISIWGIEAGNLDEFSEDLTAAVARAVPVAAEAILCELNPGEGA